MSTSLWDLSASELLTQTASAAPTPGGGSVAAVAGALGAGLVSMALEITQKRADAAAEVGEALHRGQTLVAALRADADADVQVFGQYMAALALPRQTESDKSARKQAIQTAVLAATHAPLAAAGRMLDAIDWAMDARALVHPTVQSDVLAGLDLLIGATHAALRNVDINLPSLTDSHVRAELAANAEAMRADLAALARVLYFR